MAAICVLYTLIIGLLVQHVYTWNYYADMSPRNMKDGYYSKPAGISSSIQEEKKLLDYIRNVKRTSKWAEALCGRWDDWCNPSSTRPGSACCKGYTCKCNFWNSNCRCRNKLFSSG